MCLVNPSYNSGTPDAVEIMTDIPASLSVSQPFPETCGLGSIDATNTVSTPASIIAVVQGGVLPNVQQGSKVVYSSDPFACGPACLRATISAWCCPGGRVNPSPIILPSLTINAPTAGFGLVWPTALFASCTA